MKMSDVFKLPVEADILDDVAIFRYKKNKPTPDDADKAAAHAVNMHDELVDSHAWLLINFKALLRGSPVRDADEIISHAERLIKRNRGEE